MKEVTFLNKNAKKWQQFETILNSKEQNDPDEIADLFIHVTDDLAYSKSYYPKTKTITYLNQLAQKAHQLIYRNQMEQRSRIISFWTKELPLLFYQSRKYFLYSFLIFLVASVIGYYSAIKDQNFVRLIMGDGYVNMTLDNIKNGDPMAVYKGDSSVDSFSSIALNNIRVSIYAFVFGLFFSIGTASLLFSNGVMLGSFFGFLYQQNVLAESAQIVWMHGTIEISVIIISGGAGLILGNSLTFPGTYKRSVSFLKGVKKGLKIIIGLIPLFILAALIEGFVSRHSELHSAIKLSIIGVSLSFILWYFVFYPINISKKDYGQPSIY